MELLYSNILPLGTKNGERTIIDCFNEQVKKADHVEIAVGYTLLHWKNWKGLLKNTRFLLFALPLECTILKGCQSVHIIKH